EAVDRLFGALDRSREHEVQVFLKIAPDSHLGRRLEGRTLEAVHMLPLLRGEEAVCLPVLRDLDRRGGDDAVELLVLRDPDVREVVLVPEGAPDVYRLTRLERDLLLDLEGHPGERGEIDQDPDVNDVSAIAPPVALDQPEK